MRCTHMYLGAAAVLAALALSAGSAFAAETPADREALRNRLSEAQARLDEAASEVAELSRQLYGGGEGDIARFMRGGRRGAMLGVNIGTDKPRETGVEIVGVSPGGPAQQAGLRPGDVIVAIDGKALKRADEETPASRLVEYLSDVEPGTSVKVDYLRGDKRQSATVKTKAAEPPFVALLRDRFDLPQLATLPDVLAYAPFEHVLGRGFGELELVEMTPQLGSYFGTHDGLLVVRAPDDAAYQLQDGDVLLAIGGRVPESPGHAFRILRSYQPGEKLKLEVLRNRKRMQLDVAMPRDRPMHGAAPAHPAMRTLPPMAPAVPAPPPPPEDEGPV